MDIIAPTKITNDAAAPVTRSAGGTYFDRNGQIQVAPADTPRITYDPFDLKAAPYLLIEPAAQNLVSGSETLSNANWWAGNPSATPVATTYRGVPYVRVAKTTAIDNENRANLFSGVAAGNTLVMRMALRADTSSRVSVGLYDTAGTAWGPNANASALIVRGPGSITRVNGGLYLVTGLSTSADTLIEITRTYTANPTAGVLIYPGGNTSTTIGDAVLVTRVQAELDRATSYIPTGYLKVTRSADVLDNSIGLLWSSIVENDSDDGALWNAATAYAVGNRVRRPNHRSYVALKPGTNQAPESTSDGTAAAYWQDVGPTKRWSVFDNKYSTIASAPDSVTYLIRPGTTCTAAAALGIEGNEVRLSVVDATTGALVYRSSRILRVKNCRSLVDYFFKPISRRRDEVFDNLPPFKNGILCVTVIKPGSAAQLADFVVGRLVYAGETQWSPEVRTKRRSVIKDDGFGNITFTKRRSAKLLTVDVEIGNDLVDDAVRTIDSYTDEPCVIIGDPRWSVLIILGFVQDFRLVLEGPQGSLYNAQIEGFA